MWQNSLQTGNQPIDNKYKKTNRFTVFFTQNNFVHSHLRFV